MRQVQAAFCRPAVRLPKVSCVYGIYQGTDLLYIGSTVNLRTRIGGHALLSTKDMKRSCVVQWIEMHPKLLLSAEQSLLDSLKPLLNNCLSAKQGHWRREKYIN